MACKCIRKLVVVVTELLILILLQVQSNDLVYASFHSFSHPIQHSHFSKLDKVQTNDLYFTSFCLSSHCPYCILTLQNLMKFKEQYIHALQRKLKFVKQFLHLFTKMGERNLNIMSMKLI